MPLPLNNVSFQDWGALLTVLRIGAAWPIMRPRNTWNADHTWLFICKYELWRVAGGGSRYIKWMCFPIFSWTSSLRFWHSEAFINFLEPNQSIVPLSDNLLEKFAFELRKLKNKSIKYNFILLHIFSGAWTWLWVIQISEQTNSAELSSLLSTLSPSFSIPANILFRLITSILHPTNSRGKISNITRNDEVPCKSVLQSSGLDVRVWNNGKEVPRWGLLRYRKWVPQQLGDVDKQGSGDSRPMGARHGDTAANHTQPGCGWVCIFAVRGWSNLWDPIWLRTSHYSMNRLHRLHKW